MATIETIGVGVDTSGVDKGKRSLDQLGKSAKYSSQEIDKLGVNYDRQGKKITNASSAMAKAAQGNIDALNKQTKASDNLGSSFSSLTSLLPILGFAALSSSIIKASDSYVKFTSQLKIATKSQDEYNAAIDSVKRIAGTAQVSIEAIGTTYARLSNALKDVGTSQKDVASVTETLALSLKVNGATAEEAASSMLQLSQAFGKGKLDGDEFRTAMEAAPNVMRELAKSMGVPFGALKDLAAQGQITSDVMLKAFTNPELLAGLNEQAKAARTISGAWQEVKNSIVLAVGKLIEFTGLREKVNEKADLLVQAISEGGLLGGQTQLQKEKAAIDLINKLEKIPYQSASIKKLINNQRRILNPNLGNSLPVAPIEQTFSPNFNAPVKEGQGGFNAGIAANNVKTGGSVSKQISDYQALTRSINEKIAANKQEILVGAPLSEAEKLLADITQKRIDGVIKLSTAEYANVKAKIDKLAAGDKEIEQAKELEKFNLAQAKAREDVLNASNSQLESIQKEIDKTQENTSFVKLGEEAYNKLEIAKLNDAIATSEQIVATGILNGLMGKELLFAQEYIESLKEQVRLKGILADSKIAEQSAENQQKAIKETAKAQKDAIEDVAKTQQKAADDINKSLTDALLRGFESGKGFARNFKDTLFNLFKTLVLRPSIEFLVNTSGISRLLSSITGGSVAGGGITGGATSGSGGLGLLGGIRDIFSSGNSSIVNTIGSIGQSISAFGSAGTGFIRDIASSIGSFTQLNAGFISRALPYAGAVLQLAQGNIAGAALTAVGTFLGGPIGGLIGGAIGSLFGRKKKIPRFSTERSGFYDNGVFTGSSAGQTYKPLGAEKQLDGLSEQFSRNFGALLSGFGLDDKITTTDSLFKKRKASYGQFSATFAGGTVSAGTTGRAKNVQDTLARLVEKVLGETLVQAIQASELSAGVKKFFDGMVDKALVSDAINTLVGLNSALKDLPVVFNSVRDAIDTTAYKTSINDLKAMFDNTQKYTSLFYSEQENFATFTQQIKSQFSALNQELPTSREGFRALVDGIKVTDEASSKLFAGLVALAPAADAFYRSFDALIASLKDESNFKTLFDFQRYQGLTNNYGTAFADKRIPSYDVGTNYVPNDGLAMLHKGEAVVPAKFNNSGGGDMTSLVSEVRDLKSMMQANTAQAKRAADVLVKISPNGNAIQTEVYVP